MNSAQRRKQRRFERVHFDAGVAHGHEDVRRALAVPAPSGDWTTLEVIKREVAALASRWNAAEGRLVYAHEQLREAQNEVCLAKEAAAHETRKLTESAKRSGPVLAEFHIALRHIAEAITGVPPQFRYDVSEINKLRLKLLDALKGPK